MQLSIRHRGILVIAIPIVTIVTIILGAISTQNGVQNGLRTTSSELLPLVEVLGEVESSLSVAHAESMRQILLSMSGVKGEPFDRQSQRTQAATEWAIDALRTARSMSTTHGAFDDSELLDLYIEQQTKALEMAAIDPSTGRLLYTAADNFIQRPTLSGRRQGQSVKTPKPKASVPPFTFLSPLFWVRF